MSEYKPREFQKAKSSMSAEGWYKSLPPATQLWLTTVVMVSVARHVAGVNWQTLAFDADAVFSRFEVWRVFTSLTLLNNNPILAVSALWTMITYSDPLERGAEYLGDYTYTLLLGVISLLAAGTALEFRLLGDGLVFFVLGTWCCDHRQMGAASLSYYPMQEMIPLLWACPIPAWIFPGFMATWFYCVGGELPVVELFGLVLGMLLVLIRGSFLGTVFKTPAPIRAMFPQRHEAPRVERWGRGGSLK